MPTITVIGSLNVDMVTVTDRVPAGGETLLAKSFSTGWGGKGANQAVAAHRLSRDGPGKNSIINVRMIGTVGDDQFGSSMLKALSGEGVNVTGVRVVEGESTGTATILVEESTGENRILVTEGANAALKPGKKLVGSEGYGDVVLFQLETPLDTVCEHVEKAYKKGSQVILNPAPAVTLPDSVFSSITHLILNASEAEILCGLPRESVDENSDLDSIATQLISKGVKVVVITLGGAGAFWKTRSSVQNSQPGTRVPAQKVDVVDTTAAGDTFVGGYAVMMAQAKAAKSTVEGFVDTAVQLAIHASAKTVQKSGAQSSIPWFGELTELVEDQKS